MGRTDSLRNAAGQMGRPRHRFHLRGAHGCRSRNCNIGNNLRNGSGILSCIGLCRLHDFRSRKRDRRRGGDKVDRKMVQGAQYGIGNGPPASDCASGYGSCAYPVADSRVSETGRMLLHTHGDCPPCIRRAHTPSRRNRALGNFRRNGRKVRFNDRLHGQERDSRRGQIQVLRHIQSIG